jgi:hypothetical protein
MLETAREERRNRDKKEFETLCLIIAEGMKTGNPHDFSNFVK